MITTTIFASLIAFQGPPPQPPRQGGLGGPGGMMGREVKIVDRFDSDKNGWLNNAERKQARETLKTERAGRATGPGGMRGPGGGPGGRMVAGTPGPKVAVADAKSYPGVDLYDPKVLRTIFLEFENADWEAELADFNNTDVDVPATVTLDGKRYENVGVHFRGASSYMMVPAGNKRSLNLSVDFLDKKQSLLGYRTLNLLNSNGDPSFMSTTLYSHIARNYIAAPKANHVKVVINGESWGVYVNVEQYNNDFVKANFKAAQGEGSNGARWKVPGSPGGSAGLQYLGDDVGPYKQRYEIKSKDSKEDWAALIQLTKVLSQTPIDQLETVLKPMLDVESVLWFLALDNGLANSDGYWVRASDYSIYRDPKGMFHVIPHDMNEAFMSGGGMRPGGPGGTPPAGAQPSQPPAGGQGGPGMPDGQGGRGGMRGPGGGGPNLDPLIGMNDMNKPLRSRLLQVPAFRAKYLSHLRELATKWLDWTVLGEVISKQRALLEPELKLDTRKNSSFEAFLAATGSEAQPRSLRNFIDARRTYLLQYKEPE